MQVEQHGTGHAVPRLGYEAFRLSPYRGSFLGRGRAVLDVLFCVLCAAIFVSDVAQVVRQRKTVERQWYLCAPSADRECCCWLCCHALLALARRV